MNADNQRRLAELEFKLQPDKNERHALRRFLDTMKEIPGPDPEVKELERLSEEQATLSWNKHIGKVGIDFQVRKDELDQRTSALLLDLAERYDKPDLAEWVYEGYPLDWPEPS